MLPIDEINQIVRTVQNDPGLRDLLASAAIEVAEEHLASEYDKSYNKWIDAPPNELARTEAIYAEVAGKTFADRIREYADGDLALFATSMALLLETDGHRCRSEGTLAAGDAISAVGLSVVKRWCGVMDARERDAHVALEGVTLPLDGLFKIGGFTAPAPGLFGVGELDVNCRCELEIEII
jgi:hypothetical protein